MASPASEASVQKLIHAFEPDARGSETATRADSSVDTRISNIALTAGDALSILRTLYPAQATTDSEPSWRSQALSAASSVTGSYTLTADTTESRTGASSLCNGTSNTSITSDGPFDRQPQDDTCSTVRNITTSSSDTVKEMTRESVFMGEKLIRRAIEMLSKLENSRDVVATPPSGGSLAFFYIDRQDQALSVDLVETEIEDTRDDELDDHRHGWADVDDKQIRMLHRAVSLLARRNGSIILTGTKTPKADLEHAFDTLSAQSSAQFDFQSAQFWWTCGHVVKSMTAQHCADFLDMVEERTRSRMSRSRVRSAVYERWMHQLRERCHAQENMLQESMDQSRALRDKMWFALDVKHSALYEHAVNIAHTLKAMSRKAHPKQTGVAAWARHRLRTSFGQDRLRSQMLDILAAPPEHGGLCKLTDGHVEVTSRWLTKESIENFCQGEERIHRFCYEIQRMVGKLVGASLSHNPVLWASTLYVEERERLGMDHAAPAPSDLALWPPDCSPRFHAPTRHDAWDPPLTVYGDSQLGGCPDAPRPLTSYASIPNSHIHQGRGAPHLTHQHLSRSHHSILPPSPVSPNDLGPTATGLTDMPDEKKRFLQHLKQSLTGLLVADLGYALWNEGTETDAWMGENGLFLSRLQRSTASTDGTSAAAQDSARGDTLLRGEVLEEETRATAKETRPSFDYAQAYTQLQDKMSLSVDPYVKLKCLDDLVRLAASRHAVTSSTAHPGPADFEALPSPGGRGIGMPRTKLTRLEEVMANCEERRLSTIKRPMLDPTSWASPFHDFGDGLTAMEDPSMIRTMQSILFTDGSPATLFRDLQLIASLVPSSILDHTAQGTAFWTVGLAALAVKSDLSASMTTAATRILEFHLDGSKDREPVRTPAAGHARVPLPERDAIAPSALAETSLADAARLYTISALEGDPTAARELALLYLTHPELVRRVTLPLSKPGEVFRNSFSTVNAEKHGHTASTDDTAGLDPLNFAVVFHWMSFAANAGDTDARTFLRENGDLGKGW